MHHPIRRELRSGLLPRVIERAPGAVLVVQGVHHLLPPRGVVWREIVSRLIVLHVADLKVFLLLPRGSGGAGLEFSPLAQDAVTRGHGAEVIGVSRVLPSAESLGIDELF